MNPGLAILTVLIVSASITTTGADCDASSESNKECISALVHYCVTQPTDASFELGSKCSADCFRMTCGSGQSRASCCAWFFDLCGNKDKGSPICQWRKKRDCLDYKYRFYCPAACGLCPTPNKRHLNSVRFIGTDNVVKIIYV